MNAIEIAEKMRDELRADARCALTIDLGETYLEQADALDELIRIARAWERMEVDVEVIELDNDGLMKRRDGKWGTSFGICDSLLEAIEAVMEVK